MNLQNIIEQNGRDGWIDRFEKPTVRGIPLYVIRVNLRNPRVKISVGLADGFPGTDQDALAIVRRDKAIIAINGAYFSMDTLKPIGDIVVDGVQRNFGGMGTVLAIAEDGTAIIQRVPRHKRIDWSRYEMPSEVGGEIQMVRFTTVLGCGPALVLDGQVDVNPQAEGFRTAKIFAAIRRMAVGINQQGELLMVHSLKGATFEEMAQIMKRLGCVGAMNLDGGASLFMYYRGRTLVPAGRKLTNLLQVQLKR